MERKRRGEVGKKPLTETFIFGSILELEKMLKPVVKYVLLAAEHFHLKYCSINETSRVLYVFYRINTLSSVLKRKLRRLSG